MLVGCYMESCSLGNNSPDSEGHISDDCIMWGFGYVNEVLLPPHSRFLHPHLVSHGLFK